MAPTFTRWLLQQTGREDAVGKVAHDVAMIVRQDGVSMKRGASYWAEWSVVQNLCAEFRAELDAAIDEYNMLKYGRDVRAETSGLHVDA
jgi:hypothetical protein